MRRREFIALVGGTAAWPPVARAQQAGMAWRLVLGLILAPIAAEAQEAGKLWSIGFLSPYSADYDKSWRAALLNGLRDLGYVEEKNVVMVERHTEGRPELYSEFALGANRSTNYNMLSLSR